jgi:hypothetical protein
MTFDVVISQTVGLPAHGVSVRSRPTGGTEWQMVLLAEALAERGFSVAIVGLYGAHAFMHGVRYLPAGEVAGLVDAFCRRRPSVRVRASVVISERFGEVADGLEFDRVVFDLHDLPDDRLGGVQAAMTQIPDSKIVVHSDFMAGLLPEWPRVSVIPCMVPDEFYELSPKYQPKSHKDECTYVYGSAALKGLAPTLQMWRELKKKSYHFKRARLIVTSPGYDQVDPALLEGCKDVVVQTGFTPAAMQVLLAQSDGIFHVGCMPETFGIVFAQCEIAGKPAHVLRLGYEDALDTTIGHTETLHVNPDFFAQGFDCEQPKVIAKDYRISTHIESWLDVLELKQQKTEAA